MGSILREVKVCVVGAGAAGLGAAQKLVEAGIEDFVILEAQDRVGGRCHTVPHGDYHLEFGAHWIHGEEGNVIHDWAVENGHVEDAMTLTQTGIGETMFVKPSGEVVPEDVVNHFQMIQSRIEEEKEALASYPKSFGEFFLERFRKENKWGQLGEELADWQGRFQNCIDGTESWFESSAKGHTVYVECPGNPVVNWKNGGYQNLLDHLKKNLTPSHLLLQSPVKSIDWNVTLPGARRGCQVHLNSGDVIQAGHVIFTPSLAVLKKCAADLFNPVLPADKLRAIEGLGIGCVDKIYLKFPRQWWPDGCDGFSLLRDINNIPSSITKENWEWGLVGFYEVVKQPNMLCGWICGQAALGMEQTDEELVARRCVAIMRKYLSNKFDIPDAVWCKRSTWGSNPWTRGSYSFRSVKTEAMGVCAADLAKPLVDKVSDVPIVCFAGEATHDYFYSTVHGALESGWREARRLSEYIQSTQESPRIGQVMSKARDKYQVIIVGCGAAGIGAARELTSRGINSVLILEGSDRVGGRVNTVKTSPSHHVDLGAQWVHGEIGNAIHKFASVRDMLFNFVSVDGEGDFYSESGELIPGDFVSEVMEVLDGIEYEMREISDAPKQLSVAEYFKRRFYEYHSSCVDDTPEVFRLREALFEWYIRWQRVDNACNELHHQSAHCWGNYVVCGGKDNMNPKQGYGTIINAILREANVDVVLDSEVCSVDYARTLRRHGNGFYRTDGATLPVIVKCRNGMEYESEHVVMTPSIGFLKSHLQMFSPPLPDKLKKAVETTGFGTINKIFLEFDKPFWSEDCQGMHLVWTKNVPIYEKMPPKMSPAHAEFMKKHWYQGITGFDPVPHQKAMLCGWIGGAEGEYMETLSEAEIIQTCGSVLRQFLGRTDIPNPIKVYRSQWASNKFTCGSYSYHSVPCDCRTGESGADVLNVPIYATTDSGDKVPVMVLAGEANSAKYYSTVHGALQNGMSQVMHYVNSRKRLKGHPDNIKSKI